MEDFESMRNWFLAGIEPLDYATKFKRKSNKY